MLIDTHAHLDFPDFANDLEDVLRRAEEVEVRRTITIGTSIESSRRAIELAENYPSVYAAIGVHPSQVDKTADDVITPLRELAQNPRVVAIGETGLDYHHLPGSLRKQEISETTFGAASTETIEEIVMAKQLQPQALLDAGEGAHDLPDVVAHPVLLEVRGWSTGPVPRYVA